MSRQKSSPPRTFWAVLMLCVLLTASCSTRYHSMATEGRGMEKYAEERYAHALGFMEAGRFELARQEFAIAEKTAINAGLKRLAQEGHDKAAAIIEAKR